MKTAGTSRQPARAASARYLAGGAVVVFGVVLGLLILEAGVRSWIRFSAPRPRADRPTFYYSPRGGPALADFVYPRAKVPGTFRIVVVGDSFTYPYALQFDDTFSKRLERMLNIETPVEGWRKAEVLNFGRIAANAQDEVGMVGRALDFAPDLVVLEITLNDAWPELPPDERARWARDIWMLPPIHPVLSHWKTYEVLRTRLHAARTRTTFIALYRRSFEESASWERYAASIAAMRHACKERNVAFAAVLFPFFEFALDERYPFTGVHDRIAGLARELGLPFLDLRSAFDHMDPERLQTHPGLDPHPNESAHRIASEHIYLWLEREALIPRALMLKQKHSLRGLLAKPFTPAGSRPGSLSE